MLMDRTPAWMDRAACVGVNPDLFFGGRGEMRDFEAAKAICRQCPVQRACLDYALANHEDFGCWGGTSERERRRIRRSLRVAS